MTVVVLVADPPRAGLGFPRLAETSPLSSAEAADLYGAVLRDTLAAVERSGADLLVNHPTDDDLPAGQGTGTSPAAELRSVAATALDDPSDARFEPQVGSSFAARAGNAATHLFREEDARSVAVVRPLSPLLSRQVLDAAAMKLRSNAAVVGPAPRGRCYVAGFTEPVDFADAFDPPAVETLTDRVRDAGGEVDFLRPLPAAATGDDLLDLVPLLRARAAADRIVPERTARTLADLGLRVAGGTGEHAPSLARG